MAKRNKNAKKQEGAGPFAEVPQYGNNQMDQMSRMSQLFEGDNSAFFPDDPTIVLPENQDEMDTIMISEDMELEEFDIMSENLSIKYGTSSIIGTRKYQQDSVFAGENNGMVFAVVCDGMGGMTSGDLASKTAIRIIAEDFYKLPADADIPAFFKLEVEKMDNAVSKIDEDSSGPGSGTTIVATIIRGGIMYWLSVGDSRIYVIRKNEIVKVNRDHNYRLRLDAQLEAGNITMDDYKAEEKNAEALISYIGMGGVQLADISAGNNLEENDIIILSSDGLYKRLSNSEVLDVVMCEEPDMKRAAKRLTDVVMKRTVKSQDNTSVVVMQYNRYQA